MPSVTDGNRPGGCGCLSFIFLLFLIGSFLAFVVAWRGQNGSAVLLAVAAGSLILLGVTFALLARARRDRAEGGEEAPSQLPARPSPPARSGRSEWEVRSGARHLTTEHETEEARTLKQRLTEAVSDLADNVESMPERSEGSAASHPRR